MQRILSVHDYDSIISVANLLEAWREFVRGKRKRKDVQVFQMNLMDNILILHNDLKSSTYKHGVYEAFTISDPKPRHMHKATVRDRLLHHAIYRQLYPMYDDLFVHDSLNLLQNVVSSFDSGQKGKRSAVGELNVTITG